MRHRIDGKKLGRTSEHRTAMVRNMCCSLINVASERSHTGIVTTPSRSSCVRRATEKLVTTAREVRRLEAEDIAKNSARCLFLRRRLMARLGDWSVVRVLIDVVGARCADRKGGYLRVLKLQNRRLGDGGEQVTIRWVD